MFSLPINELFKKASDINDSSKNNYPFLNFDRDSYKIYKVARDKYKTIINDNLENKNYDIIMYDYNNYSLYLDKTENPNTFFKFKFNNLDRIDLLPGIFYNYIQGYDYYSNIPESGLNTYSFSLYPEQHQPSGTCNFSLINNIEFVLNTHKEITNLNQATIDIIFLNYNFLRIYAGHAGIAFS